MLKLSASELNSIKEAYKYRDFHVCDVNHLYRDGTRATSISQPFNTGCWGLIRYDNVLLTSEFGRMLASACNLWPCEWLGKCWCYTSIPKPHQPWCPCLALASCPLAEASLGFQSPCNRLNSAAQESRTFWKAGPYSVSLLCIQHRGQNSW